MPTFPTLVAPVDPDGPDDPGGAPPGARRRGDGRAGGVGRPGRAGGGHSGRESAAAPVARPADHIRRAAGDVRESARMGRSRRSGAAGRRRRPRHAPVELANASVPVRLPWATPPPVRLRRLGRVALPEEDQRAAARSHRHPPGGAARRVREAGGTTLAEDSATVRRRVEAARAVQRERLTPAGLRLQRRDGAGRVAPVLPVGQGERGAASGGHAPTPARRAPTTASSSWPAPSPTWPATTRSPPTTWPRRSSIARASGPCEARPGRPLPTISALAR